MPVISSITRCGLNGALYEAICRELKLLEYCPAMGDIFTVLRRYSWPHTSRIVAAFSRFKSARCQDCDESSAFCQVFRTERNLVRESLGGCLAMMFFPSRMMGQCAYGLKGSIPSA